MGRKKIVESPSGNKEMEKWKYWRKVNSAYSHPSWQSELLGYAAELSPFLLGGLGLEQIGPEKVSKFTVGSPFLSLK